MAYTFNPFTGSFDNSPTVSSSYVSSSGSDMAMRALSANWESTYSTVQANSSTNWSYQGTDLKNLSANWESVYSTVKTTSATFVTTVATTTLGISAVTMIIAVSALPASPNPNTLYIVL